MKDFENKVRTECLTTKVDKFYLKIVSNRP